MQIELTVLIAVVGAILSACTFFLGRQSSAKNDGQTQGELAADMEYLKRRSDDTLIEVRETNKKLGELSERVTRVEESTKAAHKRLDMLERDGS